MVHNLERVEVSHNGRRDFNRPLGFDWAIEANNLFKKLIDEDRSAELADFHSLGHAAQLAVPSPEHFLPLLYALALKQKGEKITYFNDKLLAGSIAMTSFIIK
jgi:4,5-DOPA dioxygenase extradiol